MQKNDFENNVFKLMNNAIFGKTMVNVKKTYIYQGCNKKARGNCLVSEPKNHKTKLFSKMY